MMLREWFAGQDLVVKIITITVLAAVGAVLLWVAGEIAYHAGYALGHAVGA